MGERGRFNGEDIIDIVVRQPATAGFLAEKLHNFFVSDEPDESAIQTLAEAYTESGYDMRSVMRALFLSDFFKEAQFHKVKSPIEAIVGISRLAGDFDLGGDEYLQDALPIPVIEGASQPSLQMGQEPMNPPSVEGWHTGQEWIDSGTLMERINYAASRLGASSKPGVRMIAARLASGKERLAPSELVDGCRGMEVVQAGKHVSHWGTSGSGDGELNGPASMVFDDEDNLYVTDSRNSRVQKFTKDGRFLAKWGSFGAGEGELDLPWGITIDPEGNVFVADWRNDRVQKFTPDGEFLASYGSSGTEYGQFDRPASVAVDRDGDIYVADWRNNRVQVIGRDGRFVEVFYGDAAMSKWALEQLANPVAVDMVKMQFLSEDVHADKYFEGACLPTRGPRRGPPVRRGQPEVPGPGLSEDSLPLPGRSGSRPGSGANRSHLAAEVLPPLPAAGEGWGEGATKPS